VPLRYSLLLQQHTHTPQSLAHSHTAPHTLSSSVLPPSGHTHSLFLCCVLLPSLSLSLKTHTHTHTHTRVTHSPLSPRSSFEQHEQEHEQGKEGQGKEL
jgi:hypothetical protein